MRIFFTAATTNTGDFLTQEKAIVAEIKRRGHTLTSGEQILDHKKLESDAVQPAEEIFYRYVVGIFFQCQNSGRFFYSRHWKAKRPCQFRHLKVCPIFI